MDQALKNPVLVVELVILLKNPMRQFYVPRDKDD